MYFNFYFSAISAYKFNVNLVDCNHYLSLIRHCPVHLDAHCNDYNHYDYHDYDYNNNFSFSSANSVYSFISFISR